MAEERIQRRLAAILAADMAGFSRLMEADETGTIARLKAHRAELVDPEITAYGGRIVKTTGDGMLVEFPSVIAATECAVAIQRAMAEREAEVGEDRCIRFRIGINLGDIVIDGDDILGDGVNVAARLEGLAEPGGVCISDVVYQSVAGKLAMAFEDLGEQSVKNISKSVRVYRWSVAGSTAPAGAHADRNTSLPNKPSIAVLPFDNLSDDPQQEYFSDGMAEDLITDISKISGVSVAARNSSFAFKGQTIDVTEIARQLGVNHIVEGSVRKMGERLRINAQLIDGGDGRHVWAERYDGNMSEIFDFQDDIRAQIVSALQVSLTPGDAISGQRQTTNDVRAYDLFLKGRANYYRYTSESFIEAIDCLEKAIEIDPDFADAYGYLSYCHYWGWNQSLPGFENNLERARILAERGVELDETSAIALTRLGWVLTWLRRYDEALSCMHRALAAGPDNAEVYAYFGQILNYWGDPQRGKLFLEKALDLDASPPNREYQLGHSLLLLGELDEALVRFRRVIARAPNFVGAYFLLACTYIELGRTADAREMITRALEIRPHYSHDFFAKRFPYRLVEQCDRMLDNLRRAGLPES